MRPEAEGSKRTYYRDNKYPKDTFTPVGFDFLPLLSDIRVSMTGPKGNRINSQVAPNLLIDTSNGFVLTR